MTADHLPVSEFDDLVEEERRDGPEDGIGLCLSGGGYRAMLFHVGALHRMNELGLLRRLARVSSVSGGSITAAVLGMNWNELRFADDIAENLHEQLTDPIRTMASTTIDRGSVLGGIFLPGTVSERVADAYDDALFDGKMLHDLPADDDGPRFVINATSVQTGALVRFSRPYLADHKVGVIRDPSVRLADAVAASSAFPPVLSPATMEVEPDDFDKNRRGPLFREPFNEEFVMTDGGVYDNLGVETVWKRYASVLVSDAGGHMEVHEDPDSDWVRHGRRILDVIDNQVRSLRKRWVIDSFKNGKRSGAYWGIRTDISKYGVGDALPCPPEASMAIAATPTRLKRLANRQQNRIMNWGYAICDAALRKHFGEMLPEPPAPPAGFPFPGGIE